MTLMIVPISLRIRIIAIGFYIPIQLPLFPWKIPKVMEPRIPLLLLQISHLQISCPGMPFLTPQIPQLHFPHLKIPHLGIPLLIL